MSLKRLHSAGAALAAAIAAPMSAQAGQSDVRNDEIVVTASPIGRTVEETIIGTSVIQKEELQRRLENSIGETLRREPGVSSTFFGPGASRPIIRGLGGDRISVLDSGIGSIDASSTSPDHAAAVEPATAERIEIVRGASTLLYGSSAAGGVVNVFSGRIPRALPDGGLDGAARFGLSSVDDGREAAGSADVQLSGDANRGFVLHGEGFRRDAGDYAIPGFAESERQRALEEAEAGGEEEEEEEAFGIVENTALKTHGGSVGLSYVFENGFFGLSATAINTAYGVLGAHHEEDGEDEEEQGESGISIDLEQRRLDLDGEIESGFLLFKKTKIRVGYADYAHSEIEPTGEVGTVFSNEGWEGRVELVDKAIAFAGGEINGAVGLQFRRRNFSAIGEEAVVPPTTTHQYGVFGVKEYAAGPWRLEAGARYEATTHEILTTGADRRFDAVSVSGGVGIEPADGFFLGATAFRTERAPSTEELFSNGPHLATQAFEIGDPGFGLEVGRGVEATARLGDDRLSLIVNGFYTWYRDFIFESVTGDEQEGLPVFQFVAEDAAFRGLEAALEAELFRIGGVDVHADAAVDFVRASADIAGNLPRIPPMSGLFGVEARAPSADFRAEIEYAAAQNRTTDFELPTDGYTMLNLYATLRPFPTARGVALRFAAANLTNEEARLHTSFLKDLAPLPGRNFKLSVTGAF